MTTIIVPGTPIAQPRQRQRIATSGGKSFASNYTPGNHAVNTFKASVKLAWQQAGAMPLEGPVEMRLLFTFPRPTSKVKKRGDNPTLWCEKKPDVDNIFKACADALNGLAYRDDSQICSTRIEKVIAPPNVPPSTRIDVTSLNGIACPLVPVQSPLAGGGEHPVTKNRNET